MRYKEFFLFLIFIFISSTLYGNVDEDCEGHACKLFGSGYATNFDIRGFVSQSYIYSPDNKVKNQDFKGFEAGLQFNYDLTDFSVIRGLLKFSQSPTGKEDKLFFDYLLLDSYSSYKEVTFGVRFGKLPLAYGFYNDTRGNPVTRQGIISPPHIIWPNTQALYDGGNGVSVYMYGNIGDLEIDIEKGYSENPYLNQKEDYSMGVEGVDLDYFSTDNWHLQLDYNNHRLRFDHIISKGFYDIMSEYWNNYPNVPNNQKIDKNNITYAIRYIGYQFWQRYWSITFEDVEMNYLGREKDSYLRDNGYGVIGRDKVNFQNVILALCVDSSFTFYSGYGRSSKTDKFSKRFGFSRGDSAYIGVEIEYKKFVIKGEMYKIAGTEFVSRELNPEPDNWKEQWNIYAIQVSHTF